MVAAERERKMAMSEMRRPFLAFPSSIAEREGEGREKERVRKERKCERI